MKCYFCSVEFEKEEDFTVILIIKNKGTLFVCAKCYNNLFPYFKKAMKFLPFSLRGTKINELLDKREL